jgi:hypothetical protein
MNWLYKGWRKSVSNIDVPALAVPEGALTR